MENSLNTPGNGETDTQEKKLDIPLKYINILGPEQYPTRSVKVMIQFPPQKESDSPDEKSEVSCLPENTDNTGDKTAGLPDNTEDKQENRLLFYGVVKDNHDNALEGVAVLVFACYQGEIEKPLGYTFTDNSGTYSISIPEFTDYKNLEGFLVRAGKGGLPHEDIKHPDNYGERPRTAPAHRDFHHFLRFISNNPSKSIYDLMKRYY